MFYAKTFLLAGVVLPVGLHVLSRGSTPWWPDTVSLGLAFGVAAVLIAHQTRNDREVRRRVWAAVKDLAGQWRQTDRRPRPRL
jgi:hypothetical protein